MGRAQRISYPGHGEEAVEALLVHPTTVPRGGVLLIHGELGLDPQLEGVAERLAQAGFVVLAPVLGEPAGAPGCAGDLPDRRVLADLERGLERLEKEAGLDDESLACWGARRGGTYALLLACTSRRLSAAVDFCGPVVYSELSANRPSQPLELALNLSCPLLAFYAGRDEDVPLEHVERLRTTLEQFSKDARVQVFQDAGPEFSGDPGAALRAADAHAADQAWQAALEFLSNALDSQRAS